MLSSPIDVLFIFLEGLVRSLFYVIAIKKNELNQPYLQTFAQLCWSCCKGKNWIKINYIINNKSSSNLILGETYQKTKKKKKSSFSILFNKTCLNERLLLKYTMFNFNNWTKIKTIITFIGHKNVLNQVCWNWYSYFPIDKF